MKTVKKLPSSYPIRSSIARALALLAFAYACIMNARLIFTYVQLHKTLHSLQLMQCLYYANGITVNFLPLVPRALISMSKEQRCYKDQRGTGNVKIEQVFR